LIGEGNLDTQLNINRNDEIGLLAREFNIMAVKLRELDQLKDAFVSSVSHELRSPLTAISGYVELLTLKPINELNPEKTKKALEIIQESTTRLTQFVNDILDVAKIKAGKMEIHKTPFDTRATCDSVFGLFFVSSSHARSIANTICGQGWGALHPAGRQLHCAQPWSPSLFEFL
jgi:signal transduction histidine kinase